MIDFNQCLNIDLEDRWCLPDRPAVYIIYALPDIALYIGATRSLRNRAAGSDQVRAVRNIHGLRMAWFPLPLIFHKKVESGLIQQFLPVLNTCHKPKDSHKIHLGWTSKIVEHIANCRREPRSKRKDTK